LPTMGHLVVLHGTCGRHSHCRTPSCEHVGMPFSLLPHKPAKDSHYPTLPGPFLAVIPPSCPSLKYFIHETTPFLAHPATAALLSCSCALLVAFAPPTTCLGIASSPFLLPHSQNAGKTDSNLHCSTLRCHRSQPLPVLNAAATAARAPHRRARGFAAFPTTRHTLPAGCHFAWPLPAVARTRSLFRQQFCRLAAFNDNRRFASPGGLRCRAGTGDTAYITALYNSRTLAAHDCVALLLRITSLYHTLHPHLSHVAAGMLAGWC